MSYRTPIALEMSVRDSARKAQIDTARAIESFFYHRFMCRVFSCSDSPFVLKGGRSVLARTTKARYSRDADFAVTELSLEEAMDELVRLAAVDLNDFVVFDLQGVKAIRAGDDYRDGARLSFGVRLGAKRLHPITIDLVAERIPHEAIESVVPIDRLELSGLPVFDYRVVSIAFALADKFCAILEVHGDRASSRVKDLIDILVYMQMDGTDGPAFASKLKHEARLRGISLPRHFDVPAAWYEHYSGAYEKMIGEVGLGVLYPSLQRGVEVAAGLYDSALAE